MNDIDLQIENPYPYKFYPMNIKVRSYTEYSSDKKKT